MLKSKIKGHHPQVDWESHKIEIIARSVVTSIFMKLKNSKIIDIVKV